ELGGTLRLGAGKVLVGATWVVHCPPHHRVFADPGEQRVDRLLHRTADVCRTHLDVPAEIGQFQHRHHAVDRYYRDAVDFRMSGRREFGIGRQAVDVGHLQPGVRYRLLDSRQRMSSERNLGRASDFGKAHTADRHLASVLPHAVSPTHSAGAPGARRNCGKVMLSFNFSKTTSTRRPTFASVYGASSRLPAISAPGASSSSTVMLAYG